MPTEPHSFPSGFYLLVENAVDVVLEFPADEDSGGPFWNDDGQLDLVRCKEWDQEEVGVVPLGGNRYRLAERQLDRFPDSGCTGATSSTPTRVKTARSD